MDTLAISERMLLAGAVTLLLTQNLEEPSFCLRTLTKTESGLSVRVTKPADICCLHTAGCVPRTKCKGLLNSKMVTG